MHLIQGVLGWLSGKVDSWAKTWRVEKELTGEEEGEVVPARCAKILEVRGSRKKGKSNSVKKGVFLISTTKRLTRCQKDTTYTKRISCLEGYSPQQERWSSHSTNLGFLSMLMLSYLQSGLFSFFVLSWPGLYKDCDDKNRRKNIMNNPSLS